MASVEQLLETLTKARRSNQGWTACCPAHDDSSPSLSIGVGENGRILVNCHAGCEPEAVVRSIGWTMADLMGDENDNILYLASQPPPAGPFYVTHEDAINAYEKGPCSHKWPYHNTDGLVVGYAVRWNLNDGGKEIRPIAKYPDGWKKGGMPGSERPLYNIIEIKDATNVVVTEGEKCADAAATLGFVATTNSQGAKAWDKTDWSPLAGKHVLILTDNDGAGEIFGDKLGAHLRQLGCAVVVLLLPGLEEGGDIADWIDARPDIALEDLAAEIKRLANEKCPPTTIAVIEQVVDETPDDPEALPQDLLRAPGFISDVMAYNLATTDYPQPELAFAGALALLATLTGRKIEDRRKTRTNVYLLGLAPVGAGKEHARTINQALLKAAGGLDIMWGGGFSAGVSIASALAGSPALLAQTDEISKLIRSVSSAKAPHYLQTIVSTLLQLYSSSSKIWNGDCYADRTKNKTIIQPHLVLFGTAPPEGFWRGTNAESVVDGLIARMMIFEAGYVVPPEIDVYWREPPPELVKVIKAWLSLDAQGIGNLGAFNPTPIVVPTSVEAADRFRQGHMRPIAMRRQEEAAKSPERAAIWSRTAEKTAKLALLFAASRAGPTAAIEIEDMERSIRISNWLTRKMVRKIFDHVSENDRESASKRVLKMIRDGMTKTELVRRTQWLSRRDRDEIIDALAESGLIHKSKFKDSSAKPVTIITLNNQAGGKAHLN